MIYERTFIGPFESHLSIREYGKTHGKITADSAKWKIVYFDQACLAHELAHAIELKVKGWTSEETTWELAKTFLKPKYWDEELYWCSKESYESAPKQKGFEAKIYLKKCIELDTPT